MTVVNMAPNRRSVGVLRGLNRLKEAFVCYRSQFYWRVSVSYPKSMSKSLTGKRP